MLQITAVCNLAADPELKTIGDREVANFTLMVNKRSKGKIAPPHFAALYGVHAPRSSMTSSPKAVKLP